ncbi:hypothetical protein QL285_090968 [Trifolium repens]|nr:hypothetical protein QL285_090968 [Trifolium repens]
MLRCIVIHEYCVSIEDLTEFEYEFIRYLKEFIRYSHTQQVESAAIIKQVDVDEEENAIVVLHVSSDSMQSPVCLKRKELKMIKSLLETSSKKDVVSVYNFI